jgi:hypothetical protein
MLLKLVVVPMCSFIRSESCCVCFVFYCWWHKLLQKEFRMAEELNSKGMAAPMSVNSTLLRTLSLPHTSSPIAGLEWIVATVKQIMESMQLN